MVRKGWLGLLISALAAGGASAETPMRASGSIGGEVFTAAPAEEEADTATEFVHFRGGVRVSVGVGFGRGWGGWGGWHRPVAWGGWHRPVAWGGWGGWHRPVYWGGWNGWHRPVAWGWGWGRSASWCGWQQPYWTNGWYSSQWCSNSWSSPVLIPSRVLVASSVAPAGLSGYYSTAVVNGGSSAYPSLPYTIEDHEGVYRYDGGPLSPLPMPEAAPKTPHPSEKFHVSTPATARIAYPAYGEAVAPPRNASESVFVSTSSPPRVTYPAYGETLPSR